MSDILVLDQVSLIILSNIPSARQSEHAEVELFLIF